MWYNRRYFEEGIHYFKLEGAALAAFKSCANEIHLPVSPFARCLYLWTERGVLRHCKILDTPEAWEVFSELETLYFAQVTEKSAEEIADDKSAEPLGQDKSTAARREAQKKPACVYAFEMSNDSVKIGHTSDVQNRISRMPREFGLDVMREHHSPDLPRDDARRIEKTLHRKYSSLKIDGEFFRVNFPEVCAEIDRLSGTIEVNFFEEHEEIPALSEYDRLNLLVKLVAAPEPSPLKERLAVEVAQVLLDY